MHRWRRWAVLLLCVWLVGAVVAPPMVGADPDRGSHAGLVIRRADGALTYAWVAFPEPEISGVELLHRSGVPILTAGFGGLGEAICQLEGEGCSLTECRRSVCQVGANAPYWRYFQMSDDGEWVPGVLGASISKVRDGDVDGWSWTADESFLPTITPGEVAVKAGAGASDGPAIWRSQPVARPQAGTLRETGVALGLVGAIVLVAGAGVWWARQHRSAA